MRSLKCRVAGEGGDKLVILATFKPVTVTVGGQVVVVTSTVGGAVGVRVTVTGGPGMVVVAVAVTV